ncbi:MAG: prephenate dehydrogenase/arogenate dehydrogenase family protein [Trichlorobacter sp.]|nr:prephenate dehydrogenase/arogenate dehydrogenase family protein [Trichlorobacter sp.]
MNKPIIKTLTVVGVGLIGGSFALALKKSGAVERIIGFDTDSKNLQTAVALGVIDEAAATPAAAFAATELVFMAVPVGSMVQTVAMLAPHLDNKTIVTDGGSVKSGLVQQCEAILSGRARFVGGHPIAGTEHSGANAAFAELFNNRRCILTPTKTTDQQALDIVRSLWEAAGSKVETMDPQTHDRVFAAVSHLPHMVAFALVHAVAGSAEGEENILNFSAGGFRDFTRIASSDPVMWRDIAIANRAPLLELLDIYSKELSQLRQSVETGDADWLEQFFRTSKRLRDGIV